MLANILCKESDKNTLGLLGHVIAVTNTQLYHCSLQTDKHNTSINGHGCGLRKLYLQKHSKGLVFGPLIWHAPVQKS